ncbi:MAG: hypothetical protein EOR84_06355 [Mesorhizobium sp.]|uniref:hypothetical protein n=1 Tax=Mesorhizobium sp. TaxID=1871066 RepID=UPI000FE555AF|nr:hypothetical protein [Mesorhizobium sp.]RWN01695.1 MAG: hypothetical protein EOR84_06355 [Mesorhizobium sp.]
MKALAALIAAVALFGSIQLFYSGGSEGRTADESAQSPGDYRLVANGDEASCAVKRGSQVAHGLSLLTVTANCRQVLPGIERAKFWREQDDGTVTFSANGIDPIVTFGVADGEGYESYAPALPLLSLAAKSD